MSLSLDYKARSFTVWSGRVRVHSVLHWELHGVVRKSARASVSVGVCDEEKPTLTFIRKRFFDSFVEPSFGILSESG